MLKSYQYPTYNDYHTIISKTIEDRGHRGTVTHVGKAVLVTLSEIPDRDDVTALTEVLSEIPRPKGLRVLITATLFTLGGSDEA